MAWEIRRVPSDWKHPKESDGRYDQNLRRQSFDEALSKWDEGYEKWKRGFVYDYADKKWIPKGEYYRGRLYKDYAGLRPVESERSLHMPHWTEAEKTHYQMYQNVTEGTPESPVFASLEELYKWCKEDSLARTGTESKSDFDSWRTAFGY